MSYRRGQKKDFGCYNCNQNGHYSRGWQLPKWTRKEEIYQVLAETGIFWEVMEENTEAERFFSRGDKG